MNHSHRFWDLVAKYDCEWESHRRAMRQANHFIPEWLNA
jgi:predicted metal-dependent hydrolase